MENFLNFIQLVFPVLLTHKYIFLFLGAMIEGLSTLIIGWFLLSTGSIKFWPTFFALLGGYVVNGYIWYSVGYFAGARPIQRWILNKPKGRKVLHLINHYFEMHSGKALILTKFTFSLTIATLVMAGSLKYNLRKFSIYNFIASACWVGFTLFIGYSFGQSYRLFFVYIKDLGYFVLFMLIAIVLVYVLKWIWESVFIRYVASHEMMKHFGERIKTHLDIFLPNGENDQEDILDNSKSDDKKDV